LEGESDDDHSELGSDDDDLDSEGGSDAVGSEEFDFDEGLI
jgi:hypothetical protein